MSPQEYDQFTRQLTDRLSLDKRVIGLVALGSMARQDYQPDEWSDHDFYVVVEPGTPETFRTDLSWLPEADQIVLQVRETAHGLKVVYRNAHLLEFAVFDPDELKMAGANRYRVLLDRGDLEQQMQSLKANSARQTTTAQADPGFLFGMFLTNLLVGLGRHSRGEKLSGQQFVKSYALRHLLILLTTHLPSPDRQRLDNLDPFRRVELVHPDLGQELNRVLLEETPLAARGLLALARRELTASLLLDYPTQAVALVEQVAEVAVSRL